VTCGYTDALDLGSSRPMSRCGVFVAQIGEGTMAANLVLCPVGGENSIEVHAGGAGRTHFIVDVQAYIPFGII
jgi:hypothetical protein